MGSFAAMGWFDARGGVLGMVYVGWGGVLQCVCVCVAPIWMFFFCFNSRWVGWVEAL